MTQSLTNVTIEPIGDLQLKIDLESLLNIADYNCDDKNYGLYGIDKKCDWFIFYNECTFKPEITEKEIVDVYSKQINFGASTNAQFPSFLRCYQVPFTSLTTNVNSITQPRGLINHQIRSKRILRFYFELQELDGDRRSASRQFSQVTTIFRDLLYKRLPSDEPFVFSTLGKDRLFTTYDIVANFQLQMACREPYLGFDCWFTCSKNSICSCLPNIQSIKDACTISCKEGYVERYIRYILPYAVEVLINCDQMDPCFIARKNNQCNSSFLCFSLKNNTFLCDTPHFNISNLKNIKYPFVTTNKSEVFKTVFFQYEQFQLQVVTSESLKVVGSVVLSSAVNKTFVKPIMLDNQYMVLASLFDIFSQVDINMTFVDWPGFPLAQRTLIFSVHLKPTKILFYDYITNQSIPYKAGINQTIRVNLSVAPLYRTIIYWKCSVCRNDTQVFGMKFTVKIDINIYSSKLTCHVALISYPRGVSRLSKSIYITRTGIDIQLFGWNNYSSFIDFKTPISCTVTTIAKVRLGIIQLDGNSMVEKKKRDIKPDQTLELVLEEISGGQYQFVCILYYSGGIFQYSNLEFIVRALPTFVCLFFFPHTRGELVQCAHDGYAPKEFLVMMSYYDKTDGQFVYQYESNQDLNVDANAFLRIHYKEVESNEFRIVCNVTSLHYTQSKVYEYISYLNNKVVNQYTITKTNQQCQGTGPDLNPPHYVSIQGNVVQVKQYVLRLKLFSSTLHQALMITLAILAIFGLCFMCIFMFLCLCLRIIIGKMNQYQQKIYLLNNRQLLILQTAHSSMEATARTLLNPNVFESRGYKFMVMMTSDEVDMYNTTLLKKQITAESL